MKEYDEGRVWYKQKGKVVTVGITEKALEEMGKILEVSLPVEGDECFQDDVVGEIEGEKVAFEIIAPIDGLITHVNDALVDELELLEGDPLDEGWIFKIKVAEKKDEDDEEEDSEEVEE